MIDLEKLKFIEDLVFYDGPLESLFFYPVDQSCFMTNYIEHDESRVVWLLFQVAVLDVAIYVSTICDLDHKILREMILRSPKIMLIESGDLQTNFKLLRSYNDSSEIQPEYLPEP